MRHQSNQCLCCNCNYVLILKRENPTFSLYAVAEKDEYYILDTSEIQGYIMF